MPYSYHSVSYRIVITYSIFLQKLGGQQIPVFAVLSSKNITFYESENPDTHYLKDLALNDIHFLEVRLLKQSRIGEFLRR